MPPIAFPAAVQRARTLLRPRLETPGGLFDLSRLEGRVSEVSEAGAFGALSAVVGLVAQVQSRGEQTAWVATGNSLFFPPDLAFRGIDLRAVSVVLVPGPNEGLRAVDWLVRSGAFGLVVADWAGGAVAEAVAARLARVAEDRRTAVVFLTRKKPSDPSLATQVSLRGVVTRAEDGATQWLVTRDKRSGPPSGERVVFRGPFGLY